MAKNTKKTIVKVIITSTITAKALQTIQATLDGSYKDAREAYHTAIIKTIKGKPETNGQVVNAVVYSLSKGKIDSLSAARSSKSAPWLKNVEKLNNFLSSWCSVDKGTVKLLAVSKKSKGKAGSEANGGKAVTFKKSDAIAMLDKLASAKGVSRKAKALANQLAEELESN